VKTAIISDIHSNLAALESVLSRIDALACDRIICLGDIVGYAADPNECIRRVQAVVMLSIRGNHDIAALDPAQGESFNTYAREAIFWTRNESTVQNMDYLRTLRDQEQIDDIIMAHGSLLDPDEYVFSPFQAARSLEIAPCRITGVGHTHYPEVYRYEPSTGMCRDIIASEGEVELTEGYRYMINPGSVGQPRDGDYRAAFAVYDNEGAGNVRLHRVDYDVQSTMEKIRRVGLPGLLADRLLEGR
jgi:diadenosine tetraphosphatase ApaH/serine/threonine PP2A family protein phosphatase